MQIVQCWFSQFARGGFRATALLLTLCLSPHAASADYPTKPIKFVSPYTVGGGNDVAGRIMAEILTQRLGQSVIFENRPGAAGVIAIEYVARAPADGYTLLWGTGNDLAIVAALKKGLPYKIPDDLSYIGRVADNGLAFVISSKVPAKSMQEFVAYARANPGKLRYGSTGVGSILIALELFMKSAGIRMEQIPYKGVADAMRDVLGGEIDLAMVTPVSIGPYLNSNKVRVIGYTGPIRHPLIPDVPTVSELGYSDATYAIWYGLFGPAKLPNDIVERLQKELAVVLANPTITERLGKAGLTISPAYGDALQKIVVEELNTAKEIGKAQGIVLE